MPRYKLILEYDGGPFVGWQRQANGNSVQQAVEEALFRVTGETLSIRAAGRTDSGVHAFGQVSHFDLARDWDADRLKEALNFHLRPDPVAVIHAFRVGEDFDSRFSATKRHYLYRIINRRAPLTLEHGRAWRYSRPLDADAMHDAAQRLVGTHDFTTFRHTDCQAKSPIRTLERLDVARHGEEVAITASARSFLHSQIRSLAGTLALVGEGKWRTDDVVRALEARDRRACGPIAPPEGLYLTRVDYAGRSEAAERHLDQQAEEQVEDDDG